MSTQRDRRPTPRGLIRTLRSALSLALAAVSACTDDDAAGPSRTPSASLAANPELVAEVRLLTAGRGITPLERPAKVRPALVNLGQALSFDKELSGNRDISCMSCHLPRFATGDGRSLAVGQGASGLGPERLHPRARSSPATRRRCSICTG